MRSHVAWVRNRMHYTHKLGLTAVAVVALGLAACSDDDSETVESIVDDIEQAARTAVTEAEQAARTAVTEAEAAIDEAATDAVETAVRNLVAEQGEEQFTDAGYPLNDEGLSCEATGQRRPRQRQRAVHRHERGR